MEALILFAMVLGLLMIGVPIAVGLGLSSILFLLIYSDASLASIAQTLFNAFAGHFTLLAIPFFILASAFMSTGGVARRIIRFAIAAVGHFPGGLVKPCLAAPFRLTAQIFSRGIYNDRRARRCSCFGFWPVHCRAMVRGDAG